MAPGYLIGVIDVHDPARYRAYGELALPTLQRHGSELMVQDWRPTVLEGEVFGPHTVVIGFPSKEAALAWYADPEYQAAKRVRDEAATSNLMVVEGLDPAPVIGEVPVTPPGIAPGYTLTLIDVDDRDGYKAYARLAFPIMERFGPVILVDDKQPHALEGDMFGSRAILIRWASKGTAMAWYEDPEYAEAVKIRLAATDSRLEALEGIAAPT
jgi:uncharacterized protein (DUF1330 family)